MDLATQFFKTLLLKPFLVAFIVSFMATPFTILLARRLGLVDDPAKRKHPARVHEGIIPRAGGLAIFAGFFISVFFFLPHTKQFWGIAFGAFLLIFIGLLDDKYDLSPYFRFLTNVLAAIIVVGGGTGISYITNPLDGVIYLDTLRIRFDFFGPHSVVVWADLFAVIWIVWCMNMVNWSKGVDGQMPGFVAISAFILGLLSFRFLTAGDLTQWTTAGLAFIAAGAFLGFLPFNFFPQKIMPGYGGGTLAGYILAVLSILSVAKVGTALLVLGIPMIDAFYTVGRRLWAGKSPFWHDRGHLHHRLLDIGWGKRRIALFYWIVSAILGAIALFLNSSQKLFAFLLVGVIMGGVLLWLAFFLPFLRRLDRNSG